MARVLEDKFRENRNKENKKKRNSEDFEDMILDKDTRQEQWFSETRKKDAFESAFSGGINSDESIFDRQAVFRTKQKE